MYRCQITGRNSNPGEPLHKIMVAFRNKTYTKWVRDEDTKKWSEVEAGVGFEPTKELSLSSEGVNLWESWSAEDKALFLKNL
jgi:hypothetical protein